MAANPSANTPFPYATAAFAKTAPGAVRKFRALVPARWIETTPPSTPSRPSTTTKLDRNKNRITKPTGS
jgi:hypothetical protein